MKDLRVFCPTAADSLPVACEGLLDLEDNASDHFEPTNLLRQVIRVDKPLADFRKGASEEFRDVLVELRQLQLKAGEDEFANLGHHRRIYLIDLSGEGTDAGALAKTINRELHQLDYEICEQSNVN